MPRMFADSHWQQEAGPPMPCPPLGADIAAEVLVVGGGFTGMWTCWQLLERGLSPSAIVLLDAYRCGDGASGRNGGFVNSLWLGAAANAPVWGAGPALAVGHASATSVSAIGRFCDEEGVDAWYRPGVNLDLSTSTAHVGDYRQAAQALAAIGQSGRIATLTAEAAQARVEGRWLDGAALDSSATVQPARLAYGLRRRLGERGVRVHEHSPVQALDDRLDGVMATTPSGSVRARSCVLAMGADSAGLPVLVDRLIVASSHIAITAPDPGRLARMRWEEDEALSDTRTLLHYARRTPDGRVAYGWGGGRIAYGRRYGGIVSDSRVLATTRTHAEWMLPGLQGVRWDGGWGGPIDVSPHHLPQFGHASARVVYGAGYTGNGVGPSHLGGRILADLALDRRTPLTNLPIVDADVPRLPARPLRYLGGALVRGALIRVETAEEAERAPSALDALLTSLPDRLGVRLVR